VAARGARAAVGEAAIIWLLVAGTPSSHGQWFAAFVRRLHELGWIEGRTVAIEYRWAEGRTERFDEIAAEFVRRKVDVIVTSATAAVVAAKQATSVIPIVFAAAGDPVGAGLVASLARPGGNVIGLSIQQPDVAAKRLELLREVVPSLGRLAILGLANQISDSTGFSPWEYGIGAKWLELLKQIAPSVTRVAVLRDPAITAGIGLWGAIRGSEDGVKQSASLCVRDGLRGWACEMGYRGWSLRLACR
jgi:hypothetical protein